MERTVEERLAVLERRNRRLTACLCLAGIAFALLVVSGAAEKTITADLIQTRKLEILDQGGRPRAVLDAVGEAPCLQLVDEHRNARAMFGTRADGSPVLDFLDRDGNVTWSAASAPKPKE